MRRQLDGLPLAIELLVGRLPLFGLRSLATRLDQRFKLLTAGVRNAPTRQQTLLATLEWSHDLLARNEKEVFRRLGVFVGGFSLEGAELVACFEHDAEWDVVDALSGLVDRSLVFLEDGERPRYRLLESARAFALNQTTSPGRAVRVLASERPRAGSRGHSPGCGASGAPQCDAGAAIHDRNIA
jgi:predicted ATPase